MNIHTPPAQSLSEAEQELTDNLSMLEGWNDRYDYIIGLGRAMPPFPDEWHTEDREVQGCQSQVWLDAHAEDGRVWLRADSNAMITKGLVAMLVELYSGRTPEEILGANLEFLRGIGLASHLTPSRVNGLFAMFARIQRHAKEVQSKEN